MKPNSEYELAFQRGILSLEANTDVSRIEMYYGRITTPKRENQNQFDMLLMMNNST